MSYYNVHKYNQDMNQGNSNDNYANNRNYQRNQNNQQDYNQNNHGRRGGRQNDFMNDMFNDFDMCKMMDDFEDPFDNMFSNFGSRQMGNIFGNAERMMQRFHEQMNNEMRMIGNFDDPNNRGVQLRSNSGNPGTFISKSYVSRVNYKDGQPQREEYQSQSINQFGSDGRKISERQEAYKNSNGLEKASHQRTLDGRGQKIIKQRNRNTGEVNEHNIYKDLQENDLDNFNKEYNDYRNKCGFQNNYKALGDMDKFMGRRMIGNGRRSNQPQALGLPSGDNQNNFRNDNNPSRTPLSNNGNEVNNSGNRWNTRRNQTKNSKNNYEH